MSLRSSTQHALARLQVGAAVSPAVNATRVSAAFFSTTQCVEARKTRDLNKLRGVSALRRQYPKEPLEMSRQPLPKPIMDAKKHTPVETDPNHGLWGFFDNKEAPRTPERDAAYGREWVPAELRNKSFSDLHKLWYVCVKERNIIATSRREWARMKPGYGDREASDRDRVVRKTMKAIKHVLTERYYAWQDAVQVAESDPEVDMSGAGPAYVPHKYQDAVEEELPEAAKTELPPVTSEKASQPTA